MKWEKLSYKLTGRTPLLMHNPRLANPLDLVAKAIKKISGKRQKTEADFVEMSHLEFLGSLYQNENGVIAIPGKWIEGALTEAAKKSKKGKMFKTFVLCEEMFPLEYDGPADPEELWNNKEFVDIQSVRVGQSRVQRTRPIFRKWAANVDILFLEGSELEKEDIDSAIKLAEVVAAIGDGRPKYGRFEAEPINHK